MKFEIPRPLKAEHDGLHGELVEATKASARTGDTAKTVANLLHPHFVKEEQYALPPAGAAGGPFTRQGRGWDG